MRRLVPWILWSSGGLTVLIILAIMLWIWLPRWTPVWVIRHSPWLDPVLRAASVDATPFGWSPKTFGEFRQRIFFQGESAFPALVQGLDASDAILRAIALEGVAVLTHRYALSPDLEEQVCQHAVNDEERVRLHAFIALDRVRTRRSYQAKRTGMNDPAERIRAWIARGVASGMAEEGVELLQIGLRDQNPDVRSSAIVRIIELQEKRTAPTLITMMNEEADEKVRGLVVQALGMLEAIEALPAFRQVILQEGDPRWKQQVIHATFQLKHEEVRELMVTLLQQGNGPERAYAAFLLGRRGDPKAVPALVAKLDDPDPMVFGQVINALITLEADGVIAQVIPRMESIVESLAQWQKSQGTSWSLQGEPFHLNLDFAMVIADLGAIDQGEAYLGRRLSLRDRWQGLMMK